MLRQLNINESAPYSSAAAITPSDTVNLAEVPRGVYVGSAGVIVAVLDGSPITFTGALAGTILPIKPTRINATSTTATGLVALY